MYVSNLKIHPSPQSEYELEEMNKEIASLHSRIRDNLDAISQTDIRPEIDAHRRIQMDGMDDVLSNLDQIESHIKHYRLCCDAVKRLISEQAKSIST